MTLALADIIVIQTRLDIQTFELLREPGLGHIMLPEALPLVWAFNRIAFVKHRVQIRTVLFGSRIWNGHCLERTL